MINNRSYLPTWGLRYEEGKNSHGSDYCYWEVVYFYNNSWVVVYTTNSYEKAQCALNKCQDCLDETVIIPSVKGLSPVMFEYAGQIFKVDCINIAYGIVNGLYINGNNFYGNTSIHEAELSFDYIEESIKFYNFGDALVQNGQLFLNGDLILNQEMLKNVCNEIHQDMDKLNTNAHNLIEYIFNTFDNVKAYICDDYYKLNLDRVEV